MTISAFKCTFSDMKLVKTRQVAQLIFEIPLSEFDGAYEVLGGMPNPAQERWFAVAAISVEPQQEKSAERRNWNDLQPQQQAGIRSGEPAFVEFLKQERPDDWREAADVADCIRIICGVHSRVELGTNQKAKVIWHQLDSAYQAWKLT